MSHSAAAALSAGMKTGVSVVALATVAAYLWLYRGELSALPEPKVLPMIACAAATCCYLFAMTATTWFSLRRFAASMRFSICLSATLASSIANLFLPGQLTVVLRGVIFRRLCGLELSAFAGGTIGVYVIVTICCALLALAAVVAEFFATGVLAETPILLAVAACVVGGFLLAALPVPRWLKAGSIVRKVLESWHDLRRDGKALALTTGSVMTNLLCQNLTLWLACRALGLAISPLDALLAGSLGSIATIAGLTPGGIGIYEAVVAYTAHASGVPSAQIVAASLLSRLILALVLFIWLPIAAVVLPKRPR